MMLSAPHAVKHFRTNQFKVAELYTGAIARYLSKSVGCCVICSTRCETTDPNYDVNEISEYKQALKKYVRETDIRMVIDLHACLERNPAAVEIGTINDDNKSLQDMVISFL